MNISSTAIVNSSARQAQASTSAAGGAAFSDALAQVTGRASATAPAASASAPKAAFQSYALPSLWLNGLEDAAPVNLLLDASAYKARLQNGRADEGKPNLAQFMAKTGLDVKESSKLLYGSLGAIPDMRDWSAIMASDDPAIAARQATNALINSEAHASYIGDSLKSAGYTAPRDGDIVTRAGNLTVVKEGASAERDAYSLRITGASGHIIQSVPWSAEAIAGKMQDYGIETRSLEDLVKQLGAKGISYAALKLS